MNGSSPKPQLDFLTSWSWQMRWVSSILPLLRLPPLASGIYSSTVSTRSHAEPGCEMSTDAPGVLQSLWGGRKPLCMTPFWYFSPLGAKGGVYPDSDSQQPTCTPEYRQVQLQSKSSSLVLLGLVVTCYIAKAPRLLERSPLNLSWLVPWDFTWSFSKIFRSSFWHSLAVLLIALF